ncbi:MAG: hypothetical protein H6834_18555 [Planctomycetes bacterium]|nr:hypothetical protein [Planctomycetota bacterium]
MEVFDDSPSLPVAVLIPSVGLGLATPLVAEPFVPAISLPDVPTPRHWQERACSFCGHVRSSRFRFGPSRGHPW